MKEFKRFALVAMNGRVNSTAGVLKTDTADVQAFQSPNSGALGYAPNGKAVHNMHPSKKHAAQWFFDVSYLKGLPEVGIVYRDSNIEADLLAPVLDKGGEGIIHACEKGILVVRSSRVPAGPASLDAEAGDDRCRFIASSQELPSQKSPVLLVLALGRASGWKQIQEYFNEY